MRLEFLDNLLHCPVVRAWITGIVLVGLGIVNLSMPRRQEPRPVDTRFVTREGTALVYRNEPLRFVGVNCFRLSDLAPEADSIFAHLAGHGIRVVRFWAFQSYCGANGTDFTIFDAIVAAARRHDILLLPVVENHWHHCTDATKLKPPGWYRSGWRTEAVGPLPYRDYLRAIGAHFRDEPQILAWQLMNEPEVYPDTYWNFDLLRDFAAEASHELRSVDPNHLISLGLLGIGQPATTGKRFRALHKPDSIDIVSAHDYGYIRESLPGLTWKRKENSLYADLCDARSLGKPFLVTEAGIPLPWLDGDAHHRAELFCTKLRAFFEAGGNGFILWNYEPTLETDHGFDPNDPLLPVLRQIATELKMPN